MPKQAKASLFALIESSEVPIWSVDLEHRLLIFNSAMQRACERNLGVCAAVGMRPQDSPLFARGEFWPPLYNRAVSQGPFRIEFQTSTGRLLELAFNPIVVDEKATGVSVFGKDITERKQSEAALLAAEMRYRDLFEGANEGMFQASLVDNSLSANSALARILGYESPEEFIAAMKASRESVWADLGDYKTFRVRLLKDGSVQGFECRWRRIDGSVSWVSIDSRVIYDDQGRAVSHGGSVKDITERKRAEMHLRDSEERFRATFEQAAVGIVHVSFDGEILACNPSFAAIVGYSREELTGMSVKQITPPEFLAQSDRILRHLASGNPDSSSWEKPYVRKDGAFTWVRLTASIQRDGEGRPLHHITFVEDINSRKDAEQALNTAVKGLKTSETRYRTVFQTILDSVGISRASDGMFVEVNEAFLRLTGYERSEVIGRTAEEVNILPEECDRKTVTEALERNSSFRDIEIRLRKKNGEVFWGLASGSVIDLDGVPCILSVTRDISDVKAAQGKIRDLAFYDPLTRLPNRRLLLDRLKQALTTSTRVPRKMALLFVDLDHFKILNDSLGHQAGDQLLQEVALRLTATVRESDTVARLGGDEFVVMLGNLTGTPEDAAAQAKAVAEKISAALGKSCLSNHRKLHSHSSIGITVFGSPHRNPNEILQQAEIAMYQAKDAGRNSIRFFSPALQAVVNARTNMEEALRQAIKAEQLVLYYQPQVNAAGIFGVEALIRWNHPQRGLLLPGEFIPLAEETGLILGLGNWALETACAQIAAWENQRDKAPFAVSVNISALEFRQVDFVDRVLAALRRTGANPTTLTLELTESMLVENIEDVIAKMTELRAHGLSFSLDDFGTGYSSLSYLKRLPLNQLKIDRMFVRDIFVDVSSGAIAQTIISLSKAMGLSVIAEGVETEGQREFLKHLGCSSFQGFLYGRPMPLEEFERVWLASGKSLALPSPKESLRR
jgi:diguanylate cyclase (GGDEF)-like protein/PAS domain S-box-containing protein